MKKVVNIFIIAIVGGIAMAGCSQPNKLLVNHQVTGLDTNCYLLYDTKTKEAALFDVGGPIDTLLKVIEQKKLTVKYLFCTHGHGDHVVGLPDIINKFPDAILCIHKQDYEDLYVVGEWAVEYLGQETIGEWIKEMPFFKNVVNFDPDRLGQPDIFLEDNMTFNLGEFEIKTIYTPGHSPGGICFFVENMLFSGDVLFYRKTGRTDMLNGSREDIIQSVQNLFKTLPDETIVYPGHYDFTDIESEKYENEHIRLDTVLFSD